MNNTLYTNRTPIPFLRQVALFLLLTPVLATASESSISITCPQNITVGIYGNNCTSAVSLPNAQASSTCGGSVSVVTTSPWGQGNGPFTNVAQGTYTVQLRATDACGNVQSCSYTVQVADKKAPKPTVTSTLFGNLDGNGQLRVSARQFDQGSTDNCSGSSALRFTFSNQISDSIRVFDCGQIGTQNLQVWVTDPSGNTASSPCKLEVMGGGNGCQKQWNAQINVKNCLNQPISGANLSFSSSSEVKQYETNQQGQLNGKLFDNRTDWTVYCKENQDPLNGVNTFDIWKLQRYVLGMDTLSAHQLLAADVNQDQRVTSGDVVELRKLVLGNIDRFQHGQSWKFHPSNIQFVNPKNPFQFPFAEQIQVSAGVAGTQTLDFTGVKLGDLDMSANAYNQSQLVQRETATTHSDMQITIQDAFVKSGTAVRVPVYIQPNSDLAGLQFALAVQSQYLQVLDVDGQRLTNGDQVHTYFQNELNIINTNFAGTLTPDHRTHLITVSVLPKTDGYLSDFITLSTSSKLNAEAFNKLGTMFNIQLDYSHPFLVPVVESDTKPIVMVGNSPNPFVEMSILHFTLAQDCQATLRVFDADGRQVDMQRSFYTKGSQMFLLKKEDLGNPGVYHCRIDTDFGSVTRKIILF
jgi:hypothetical protein